MHLAQAIRLRQMYRDQTARYIKRLRGYIRNGREGSILLHMQDQIKYYRKQSVGMEKWIDFFQLHPNAKGRYIFPNLTPAEHKYLFSGTQQLSARCYKNRDQKWTVLHVHPEPAAHNLDGSPSAYMALVIPIPERIFPL